MSSLLRVSEAASLALHAAALMAGSDAGRQDEVARDAAAMAERLGASEAHLGKVLQRLVKAGLAQSVRGPGGGYSLTRRPKKISLKTIYEAIEGPLSASRCLLGAPVCGQKSCPLGDLFSRVNNEIMGNLTKMTLADYQISIGARKRA